jgi:hypothetical protein
MRKLLLMCALVLLVGAAFGQVTIVSGYATNQGWGGYYPAPPFVPQVTTPIVTLDTVSPSPAGASNATTGMVAGASNATLSILQPPLTPVYTVPVWSGYDLIAPGTAPVPPQMSEAAPPQPAPRAAAAPRHVDVGIASSEVEVAPIAKIPRQHEHAVRVYTNADIDRINQQNGTVKYDGKTLKIS